MSVDAEALRRHAAVVSAEQLARASRLRALGPDEQDAVSELARTLTEGIVRCLLEEAERNAALAEVLRGIYGDTSHEQRQRGASTLAGAPFITASMRFGGRCRPRGRPLFAYEPPKEAGPHPAYASDRLLDVRVVGTEDGLRRRLELLCDPRVSHLRSFRVDSSV